MLESTLKGFVFKANAFSVCCCLFVLFPPGLSLRSDPGLELANAFGVINLEVGEFDGMDENPARTF